jgi:two-component system, chemotaxis family, chemotaxis protein CheY
MPHILVIDDDHLVRAATKAMLTAKGYDVDVAANGPDGVELANKHKFDVVIVDLFMPGMDGLKVIETIRETDVDVPMIAVSGFMFGGECPTMPHFDSMAAEAGAGSTLYKPFRPDALVNAVEKAMTARV